MARELRQVLHQRHVGAECREPHGGEPHRLERLVPALLPRGREIRRIHADHAQQRVPILARHRPHPEVIVALVERPRPPGRAGSPRRPPAATGGRARGARGRWRIPGADSAPGSAYSSRCRRDGEQRSDVRAERRGVIRCCSSARTSRRKRVRRRRLRALAAARPQRVHQAPEPFPVVGDRAAPQFVEQRLEASALRPCPRDRVIGLTAPSCSSPAGDQSRPPPRAARYAITAYAATLRRTSSGSTLSKVSLAVWCRSKYGSASVSRSMTGTPSRAQLSHVGTAGRLGTQPGDPERLEHRVDRADQSAACRAALGRADRRGGSAPRSDSMPSTCWSIASAWVAA